MKADSISEAYIKSVQACTVERLRLGISIQGMADRLNTTSSRVSRVEKLLTVDVRLVDEYMMEFNFKVKAVIEKA